MGANTKIKTVASAALLATAAAFAEPDPNFHIYLAFGQSNMEGQGNIEQQDKTVDSRFQMMATTNNAMCTNRTKGQWYDATPPLASCDGKLGPVDYFGRTMLEKIPEGIKVGVIVVAVAGCDIQLFEKDKYQSYAQSAQSWMSSRIQNYGGNPYGRLIDMAKEAQKVGVIKGILFHQGETNSGQNNWPSRVKGVYDNIIKDLGLGDNIPFLAGEVHPNGNCKGMNSIIANLPQQSKNFYVVSASGINGMLQDGQSVHFDAAGYRELGKRYAAKMLEVLGTIKVEGGGAGPSSEGPASSSSVAPASSSNVASPESSSGITALQGLQLKSEGESVVVKVYSLLGKEIQGTKNLDKLPSGNYIVAEKVGGALKMRKYTVK
ncbi:MAG: acetylxylan esterase [Fibrobacteraceae bacterium]|nr:acetylxylan esterase [Fibrobacteraceae bacterium]